MVFSVTASSERSSSCPEHVEFQVVAGARQFFLRRSVFRKPRQFGIHYFFDVGARYPIARRDADGEDRGIAHEKSAALHVCGDALLDRCIEMRPYVEQNERRDFQCRLVRAVLRRPRQEKT
jgi:hypothetical protein